MAKKEKIICKSDFTNFDELYEDVVARHINPFTGLPIVEKERDFILDLLSVIYAEVEDNKIIFDPISYYFSALDIFIEIKKSVIMSEFSELISDSITKKLKIKNEYFTEDFIRFQIYDFLQKKNLIELRNNPYIDGRSYYATELGENCGLNNLTIVKYGKKFHLLTFSAYIQIYILRMFPEIFSNYLKKIINREHKVIENLIEPLNEDEQRLISRFRSAISQNKKFIRECVTILANDTEYAKHLIENLRDPLLLEEIDLISRYRNLNVNNKKYIKDCLINLSDASNLSSDINIEST